MSDAPEDDGGWGDFRQVAEDLGLADHIEGLVRLCVASVRLTPMKRSKLRTRIGGKPEVAAGFEWPKSSEGEPLQFVAQIDLAEVPKGLSGLPSRGLLSFFHGYEPSPDGIHTGSAGRVFFFEGATAAIEPLATIPAIPVKFELQTEELPPLESPFYALLLAERGDADPVAHAWETFAEMVSEYGQNGVHDEDDRPVHRLLGWADPLQADVYSSTEGNKERVPFEAWSTLEHLRASARHRLLLQLDSDPARDVLFGDGGVLSFMILEEDLAAGRFDRVWVDWQMH